MEQETISRFLNTGWVYLKRKSGRYYKCQIKEVTLNSVVIQDRFNLELVFPLDDVQEVSTWREKPSIPPQSSRGGMPRLCPSGEGLE